jgi:hypothetical protein
MRRRKKQLRKIHGQAEPEEGESLALTNDQSRKRRFDAHQVGSASIDPVLHT